MDDIVNTSTSGNASNMVFSEGGFLEVMKANIKQAVVVSYLITFVVGTVGNGMIVFIIGRYSHIRAASVHNYYVWNLAFADLFYTLTLPFYCYATITSDWQFGDFSCRVAQVFKETNRFASVFTLVALSVDRYLASFYHLSRWRTTKIGICVCVMIWMLCGLISIPFWLFSKVHVVDSNNQCTIWWPDDHRSFLFPFWAYFQLFVALILPFIIMSVSGCLLLLNFRRLQKKRTVRAGSSASSLSGVGQPRASNPGSNISRTVLVVVLVFLVCQTPYYAVEIISLQYYRDISDNQFPSDFQKSEFMILNTVAQILVFVSSCCNPVIYGLLNDNYRKFRLTKNT